MPDLKRLADDVGFFAAEVGRPLSAAQLRAAQLETLTTVLLAPRQGGKSRTLSVLATWWAFRRPRQSVLLVSAGDEASKRLLAEVARLILGSPLLAGSLAGEPTSSLVTLSNGSEIRSVPSSEGRIRGWSVDLLIVDEAIRVPDEVVVSAAMPTVAARAASGARMVLADVAGPAQGAFFDMATRGLEGAEHVRTRQWGLADCPWISPSYLAEMRESMSSLRFAAEFECTFAGESDALLTRKLLEAVTLDYETRGLHELGGAARFFAGVDWGQSRDRSSFVAVGRLPQAGPLVFGVACAKAWPSGFPNMGDLGVAAAIAESPAAIEWLTSEVVGLGGPCTQELWRRMELRSSRVGGGRRSKVWRMAHIDAMGRVLDGRGVPVPPSAPAGFVTRRRTVHTDGPVKAAIYGALRGLIEREQLLIPTSNAELWRELLMLRVNLSPTGNERIEARSGHDDLTDALGFALGPYKSKTGGWRSAVLDLATGVLPAPLRGPVAPLDPDLSVAAPCGAVVSRSPAWQSVAGRDVAGGAGDVLDRLRGVVDRAQSAQEGVAA